MSPSRRRIIPVSASHNRTADLTNASSTPCKSKVDWLIVFRISAVAVCCSRDSFSSSFEAAERFNREADPIARFVVAGLVRTFAELGLRVVAALVLLPPVFDGRAISAPRVNKPYYRAKPPFLKGGERA